jgi:hypothetical protein
VSTVAGSGKAQVTDDLKTAACFNYPVSVVSVNGWQYVMEISGKCIRLISPDGNVTTVAGTPGIAGYRDQLGSKALLRTEDANRLTTNGRGLFVFAESDRIRCFRSNITSLAPTLKSTIAQELGSFR